MIWIGLFLATCAALTVTALVADARTRRVYRQLWVWVPVSLLLPPFAASLYLLVSARSPGVWRRRPPADYLRMPHTHTPDVPTLVVERPGKVDGWTRVDPRRRLPPALLAAVSPSLSTAGPRSELATLDDIVVVVQSGAEAGRLVWLPVDGPLIVRRGWPGEKAHASELLLTDERVTRGRHCIINRHPDALRVEDCSTYGTVVDGRRVCGASTTAVTGSRIVVGSTILVISTGTAGLPTMPLGLATEEGNCDENPHLSPGG